MFRTTDCLTYAHGVINGRYTQEMTELIQGKNGEVFLDTCNPRVIIRDCNEQNYALLEKTEYIPFYELRAAAINKKSKHETYTENECKSRIDAQINTLIKNGIQHVILSAFGCGAFGNDPKIISEYYKQSILTNKRYFKVIVFAIYNPTLSSPDTNFPIFKSTLEDI